MYPNLEDSFFSKSGLSCLYNALAIMLIYCKHICFTRVNILYIPHHTVIDCVFLLLCIICTKSIMVRSYHPSVCLSHLYDSSLKLQFQIWMKFGIGVFIKCC
jgi:hypothetical protein